jgi:hypothetical protein
MLTIEDGNKLDADLFNYRMGIWRMRYLGDHINGSRLKIKDLTFLEDRHLKHLDGGREVQSLWF